jgi:hypothetical protein
MSLLHIRFGTHDFGTQETVTEEQKIEKRYNLCKRCCFREDELGRLYNLSLDEIEAEFAGQIDKAGVKRKWVNVVRVGCPNQNIYSLCVACSYVLEHMILGHREPR